MGTMLPRLLELGAADRSRTPAYTHHPASAKARAVALPMPVDAPEMTAVRYVPVAAGIADSFVMSSTILVGPVQFNRDE
jgi:hypothetical protein